MHPLLLWALAVGAIVAQDPIEKSFTSKYCLPDPLMSMIVFSCYFPECNKLATRTWK